MSQELILVVEDDQRLGQAITLALAIRGYYAQPAYTFSEGLALASEQIPRLIVLDIILPDGDGWALLSAIRQIGNGHPVQVIVISSSHVPRSEQRRHNVAHFLPKPFSMVELIEKVTDTLAGSESLGEAVG